MSTANTADKANEASNRNLMTKADYVFSPVFVEQLRLHTDVFTGLSKKREKPLLLLLLQIEMNSEQGMNRSR